MNYGNGGLPVTGVATATVLGFTVPVLGIMIVTAVAAIAVGCVLYRLGTRGRRVTA